MKKRIAMLVFMLSVTMIMPTVVHAKVSTLYVAGRYDVWRWNHLNDNTTSQYLTDVTGDKIPEAFIRDTSSGKLYVLTYNTKKKKVIKLKSAAYGKGGVIFYSKKKHQVGISTANTGGQTVRFYKVNSKKAVQKYKLVRTNGKFQPESYRKNGKKISESKYNRILRGYKEADLPYNYGY